MAERTWNGHLLAGWWSRVLATVIDSIAGLFAFGILLGIAAGIQAAGAPLALYIPFSATAVLSLWILPAVVMAITNGQSLGMVVAQIRVVRTSGEPALATLGPGEPSAARHRRRQSRRSAGGGTQYRRRSRPTSHRLVSGDDAERLANPTNRT